jgi:hypothetical protein
LQYIFSVETCSIREVGQYISDENISKKADVVSVLN